MLFLLVIERISSFVAHVLVVHDLLCGTNEEDASLFKGARKLAEHIILSLLCKVDQYVSADNEVTVCGIRVLKQVCLFELYPGLDLIGDLVGRTNLGEVFVLKVLGYSRKGFFIVQADLCLFHDLLVNVCGVDFYLVEGQVP